jgi:hypothetical protein
MSSWISSGSTFDYVSGRIGRRDPDSDDPTDDVTGRELSKGLGRTRVIPKMSGAA